MTLKDMATGLKFMIKSTKKPKQVILDATGDYTSSKITQNKKTLKEIATEKGLYAGVAVSHGATEEDLNIIKDNFNSITSENMHKWNKLLKDHKKDPLSYDFTHADKITNWANDNGLRVRGHTLVWSKMNYTHPTILNKMMEQSKNPQNLMMETLEKHIDTVVGRYKGKIQCWDVVNEVFRYGGDGIDGIFYETLGEKYVDDVFKMAHTADPAAELVFNETIGSYRDDKAKDTLNMVRGMLDRGIPVHGIGIQDHNNIKSLDDLMWFVEEVEKMGIFLEITEMDIRANYFNKNSDKHIAQAEAYYQRVKTVVDNKCCKSITFWGLRDDNTWMDQIPGPKKHAPNEPLLFDKNLIKKPAYYAVRRALEETIKR